MAESAGTRKGKSTTVKARPSATAPSEGARPARAASSASRDAAWETPPRGILERLRGANSVGYLLVFLGVALIIQGVHAMEHIVQTMQIFVFGVPGPQAGGLLGSAVDFPAVHFTYNFTLFLALAFVTAWAFGLGGFRRFDRLGMWCLIIATGIQTYHAAEHVIQISQELAVGTARPPGFIGLFQNNVIVHLTLNIVEWLLPFIAFWRFGGLHVMKEWILTRKVEAPVTA